MRRRLRRNGTVNSSLQDRANIACALPYSHYPPSIYTCIYMHICMHAYVYINDRPAEYVSVMINILHFYMHSPRKTKKLLPTIIAYCDLRWAYTQEVCNSLQSLSRFMKYNHLFSIMRVTNRQAAWKMQNIISFLQSASTLLFAKLQLGICFCLLGLIYRTEDRYELTHMVVFGMNLPMIRRIERGQISLYTQKRFWLKVGRTVYFEVLRFWH